MRTNLTYRPTDLVWPAHHRLLFLPQGSPAIPNQKQINEPFTLHDMVKDGRSHDQRPSPTTQGHAGVVRSNESGRLHDTMAAEHGTGTEDILLFGGDTTGLCIKRSPIHAAKGQ